MNNMNQSDHWRFIEISFWMIVLLTTATTVANGGLGDMPVLIPTVIIAGVAIIWAWDVFIWEGIDEWDSIWKLLLWLSLFCLAAISFLYSSSVARQEALDPPSVWCTIILMLTGIMLYRIYVITHCRPPY